MSNKKGIKRQKNIPILHSEVKEQHRIVVTPTAWMLLREEANRRNTSISELIEEFGKSFQDEDTMK